MRISKKQLFGAALLAGLTLMSVTTAFAQDAPAGGKKDQAPKKEMTIEEYFTKLDVNADGKLVDGEIKAGQLKDWDANADGAVTLEELKAAIAKRNQPKPKPTAEQKFKEMDKNADGKVVPEELPKHEMFVAIDADKNGEITLDEVKAFMAKQEQPKPKPNAEEKFKEMDKNADGKIVAEELPRPEMFAAMDADKNGEIVLDELKAFMAKQEQPKPKVNIEEKFKKNDKNADGKITADEMPNAELFARVDADKDGSITFEEFKNFMSKDQPKDQPREKDKVKEKPKAGDKE